MSVELLAPAGDMDCVKAAVSCGADAVYVGASRFSARQNATNFDADELDRAISYCHIRGVRVYLAINTLISDAEMPEALATAKSAYESGIDAYIVQDLGLIRELGSRFHVPIHASTQMTVYDEAGLSYLKGLGISRAVLARECRKEEIRRMAEDPDMELEVFCHGAICMSYSGQCLLSSFLGGRSANRGACAQPCRLPYTIKGKTGYFLSPKDLCLLSEVGDMIDMGVSSLKIEGRMKGAAYVASAVTAFRKTIDTGRWDREDYERLLRAFSRGKSFTVGCYGGAKASEVMNTEHANDDVLKSADRAFSEELQHFWTKDQKKIPVTGKLSVDNEKTVFTLSDGEHIASAQTPTDLTVRGRALEASYAEAQLSRLGATAYTMTEFSCGLNAEAYFGAAGLNALRREAAEALDRMREGKRPCAASVSVRMPEVIPKKTPVITASVKTEQQARILKDAGAILYAPIDFADRVDADAAWIPAVCRDIPETACETILCGSIGAAQYARRHGKNILAHFSMNVFNTATATKFQRVILSPELTLSQGKAVARYASAEVMAYGYLPLLTSRNCAMAIPSGCPGDACDICRRRVTVTDRKKATFILCAENGYNVMYNSVPLFMADKREELFNAGFAGIHLAFTFETPEECKKIYRMYATGEGIVVPEHFTRGHFYKGC